MKQSGLKYTPNARKGYTRMVSPRNARLRLIEFGTIILSRGETVGFSVSGKETVLTLLRGRCVVEGNKTRLTIGPRKEVFDEPPWAIYARGLSRIVVSARSRTEILVSSAPARSRTAALTLIEPSQVTERTVGSGTFERRVRTIVGEDFPAAKLLVGETINAAGKWSSYPPHRHEKHSPPDEAKLEEVYYYKLENPAGFGLQRIYTDDRRIDETHAVQDGDLCVLPRGYHPVAATPNSRLYYFWALAGTHRKALWRVDPHFS